MSLKGGDYVSRERSKEPLLNFLFSDDLYSGKPREAN